jgi:hypothetical protein
VRRVILFQLDFLSNRRWSASWSDLGRSTPEGQSRDALAQLDHLRMFFGFFAILFLVKLCVSFAAVRKNG